MKDRHRCAPGYDPVPGPEQRAYTGVVFRCVYADLPDNSIDPEGGRFRAIFFAAGEGCQDADDGQGWHEYYAHRTSLRGQV